MKVKFAVVGVAVVMAGVLGACSKTPNAFTKQSLDVTSVDEKATTLEQLDLGKPGFGPGDEIVEVAPVTDSSGATIGKTYTTVTIVSGKSMPQAWGAVDCTVALPGGNLLFHGAFAFKDLAKGTAAPVVGGTGKYAGATGSVAIIAPTDKKTELKFSLLLPNTTS
jgi:hypothetical protein